MGMLMLLYEVMEQLMRLLGLIEKVIELGVLMGVVVE
jgi:hypothetical protein